MAWNGTRTSFRKVNITPWAGVAIWTLAVELGDMGIHIFDRPFGTRPEATNLGKGHLPRNDKLRTSDQDDCRPWIQTNTSDH